MNLIVEFLEDERRQKNEAIKALGSLQRLYGQAVHDFNLIFDGLQRRNGDLVRARMLVGQRNAELNEFNVQLRNDLARAETKRDEMRGEVQAHEILIEVLNTRLDELGKKYAALKPPEPKFKVGQIVVHIPSGNAFTIHACSETTRASERRCNCEERP